MSEPPVSRRSWSLKNCSFDLKLIQRGRRQRSERPACPNPKCSTRYRRSISWVGGHITTTIVMRASMQFSEMPKKPRSNWINASVDPSLSRVCVAFVDPRTKLGGKQSRRYQSIIPSTGTHIHFKFLHIPKLTQHEAPRRKGCALFGWKHDTTSDLRRSFRTNRRCSLGLGVKVFSVKLVTVVPLRTGARGDLSSRAPSQRTGRDGIH